MATNGRDNRTLYIIVGVIAAFLIILFLWSQGYLGGGDGDDILTPPTGTPNLPG